MYLNTKVYLLILVKLVSICANISAQEKPLVTVTYVRYYEIAPKTSNEKRTLLQDSSFSTILKKIDSIADESIKEIDTITVTSFREYANVHFHKFENTLYQYPKQKNYYVIKDSADKRIDNDTMIFNVNSPNRKLHYKIEIDPKVAKKILDYSCNKVTITETRIVDADTSYKYFEGYFSENIPIPSNTLILGMLEGTMPFGLLLLEEMVDNEYFKGKTIIKAISIKK